MIKKINFDLKCSLEIDSNFPITRDVVRTTIKSYIKNIPEQKSFTLLIEEICEDYADIK